MTNVEKQRSFDYAAHINGENLTFDQVEALTNAIARRIAERQVRSVFLRYTNGPLNRIDKRLRANTVELGASVHWFQSGSST